MTCVLREGTSSVLRELEKDFEMGGLLFLWKYQRSLFILIFILFLLNPHSHQTLLLQQLGYSSHDVHGCDNPDIKVLSYESLM